MDASKDQVHLLNPTMRTILKLCDGTRTPDEIAEALGERFDCDPTTDLQTITREAIDSLSRLRLVVS